MKKTAGLILSIILLVGMIYSISVLANLSPGSSGFNFLRSSWKDTSYDIEAENLASVMVEGNIVSSTPSDDDITNLVLQVGQASSGQCACNSGDVTSYACFNEEHALCEDSNCFCRSTSSYCQGGIKGITATYTAISCEGEDGTLVYDPTFGTGSYDYNACCLPAVATLPVGPGPAPVGTCQLTGETLDNTGCSCARSYYTCQNYMCETGEPQGVSYEETQSCFFGSTNSGYNDQGTACLGDSTSSYKDCSRTHFTYRPRV